MIDFNDPTTWDAPLLAENALDLAIFALNTLAEPQGSSEEQMDALDFFSEGALERLVEMRKEIRNRSDVPADLVLSVTRSAGDDRAVLVFVETTFEPNGSDGGPGLRVLVNDDEAYVGKSYDLGAHHEAGERVFEIGLDEIAYTGREVE